jgi:chromosome segregation ATPase
LSLKQAVEVAKTASLANQKEINALQRDIDESNLREEKSLRQVGAMEREKNLLTEKIERSEMKIRELEESALQQEQTILSLQKELSSSKETISNSNNKLNSLEKSYEKIINELAQEKHIVEKEQSIVKIKDIEIQDIKRDVENWKQKCADESKSLKSMKVERDKVLRNLKISNEEIASLQNKLSISGNEILSLQKELGLRDSQIVKEHFEKKQEKVKKEQVSSELCRVKEHTSNQDAIIRKQELDVQTLHSSLKKADEQALEQKKEYDQIVSERDILAMQLIRRNDELALLHEKVKSQDITLKKGELQYIERLNDIRLLTIKIQELQREISVKKNANHDDDSHVTLLAQKDKELLQERIKVKVLSEELENPMNVHRWRKLEGSDPTIFELIQKIDLLQKRLIKKTESVMQKDAIIHQKTQEYKHLQEQLNRQPGSEVAEKLIVKENEVKEKGRQMKAMAGELNMHQSQILEYRKEIERLQNDLQEMKMKFYEMKKKEAFFKEREIKLMTEAGLLNLENACREEAGTNQLPRHQTAEVQYVGGGFRLG